MRRVAPRWDAWRRRSGGVAAVSTTGLADPGGGPFFEIFVDGQWVDITTDVRVESGVTIGTRGRSGESAQGQAANVDLKINNAGGLYSPRNPLSIYFGKIGRNTPIRISKRQGDIVRYRFHGEIPEWPPEWDQSGRDAWVSIQAAGILRRLEQGARPLKSTILREISSLADPYPFYWPLETGTGAAFGGGRLTGTASFGESQAPAGSAGAASFEGTSSTVSKMLASATIASGHWVVACWIYTPSPADLGSNGKSPLISVETPGGSTAKKWEMYVQWSSATAHNAWVGHVDDTGGGSANGGSATDLTGAHQLVMHSQQDGGDWHVDLYVDGVDVTGHTVTDTASPIDNIKINFFGNPGVPPDIKGSISHLIVAGGDRLADILGHVDAGTGHTGESAGRRMQRLCNEEGITFLPVGDLDDTESMGPQTQLALVPLLRECADVDMGHLFEPRDALGLAYRTRVSLYNQAAALSLSYAAGNLAAPLNPVDDDQTIRNDITLERTGGSSARAVQQGGPLSILPPPDGVGLYDESVTLNAATDARLGDLASWRLGLGTVDEARYPKIELLVTHSSWNAAKLSAGLALDIGDRVVIDDLPPELPPDPVSQIVVGLSETFDEYSHAITVNCVPESPYQVAVWNESRYDTAGSELAAGVDAAATSLSVATTLGPVWTQDAADLPLDIMCGGERMTVTAISGSSSPQTFTVTRSTNQISKAHPAGTSLSLADPKRWAL